MLGSGSQSPFNVHTEAMAPMGVKPESHWKVRVSPSPLPLIATITPFSGGHGSPHWTV